MFGCHLELTSGYEKARLQIMTSGLSSKQQVVLTLVTRHRRDEVGGGRREAVDSSSDIAVSSGNAYSTISDTTLEMKQESGADSC